LIKLIETYVYRVELLTEVQPFQRQIVGVVEITLLQQKRNINQLFSAYATKSPALCYNVLILLCL